MRMTTDTTTPTLTPELLCRFDRPGPRYTSYPPADRFTGGFGEADYVAALARADQERPGQPLSVYIHLPFCEALCAYCGCNVAVSKSEAARENYLSRLGQEMAAVAAHLPHRREVSQLHLGGGTPNSFSDPQLSRLMADLGRHFTVVPDGERAIEIDPRHADPGRVAHLRALGFNRLSMGVQDFAPAVQVAIKRVTPFRKVLSLVRAAREEGFESVNLDLIYGLPHQTPEAFARTVAKVVALRPERLALYSFAYVPWVKPHMLQIPAETLPSPALKLALFCAARSALLEAGYVAIGMDHFALPDDTLAQALAGGTLHRNFQGYTTRPAPDQLGFGMSAIGDVGGAYVQNARWLRAYSGHVDGGRLATTRGWRRSEDDEARRYVIGELMCNLVVDEADFRARFGGSLAARFPEALAQIATDPGLRELAVIEDDGVVATPLGRLFIRNVACVFDPYLRPVDDDAPTYSRMV